MPIQERSDKFSPHTNIPAARGIIKENEEIILVRAIGPIARALKPVCIETQRKTPYNTPKASVGK